VPYHDLPENLIKPGMENHWLQYQPCNFTDWCNETHGFECIQDDRIFSSVTPPFGIEGR